MSGMAVVSMRQAKQAKLPAPRLVAERASLEPFQVESKYLVDMVAHLIERPTWA